ncbi:MAG: homoserine kinase [Nocardioidaceae bacterium]|nr:homoserine kinase [Nocardioidaceae bacterium]
MTTFVSGPVTVSVPATSANLGPGFDTLGLALSLRDRVSVEVVDRAGVEIVVTGVGEGEVPLDETHLVYRSLRAALERMGADVPGVRMHCENLVPHARGLGSSSAAIVAGVSLARALVAGGSLLMDDDALFALAADLEGHPDNVAPALYGGFTVAFHDGHGFRATAVGVDPRVRVVAFVPPQPVSTEVARGLLPDRVSHRDASANAARAALLVAALSRQPELLLPATEDRLHQDYREPAMPETLALVRRLRADGLPAVVSGAGPTVLVFTDAAERDAVAERSPAAWRVLDVEIDPDGAQVVLP